MYLYLQSDERNITKKSIKISMRLNLAAQKIIRTFLMIIKQKCIVIQTKIRVEICSDVT